LIFFWIFIYFRRKSIYFMATATTHSLETATQAAHSGPHIPGISGDQLWEIAGIPITNTVLSTWIFMVVLFVLVAIFYAAIKTKAFPRLKSMGLDLVNRLDTFTTETVGDKKYARLYFPML